VFLLRILSSIALSLALFSACASTPVTLPAPSLPPPRSDTLPTPIPAAIPTSFIYRDGEHVYDIRETTILTIQTDTALPVFDTVETTAKLSYRIHRSDTPSIVATIDSLSIRSSRDSTSVARHLDTTVVLVFSLDLASAEPNQAVEFPSCDSMNGLARALAQSTLVRIPQTITIGYTWTDSVTASLCRGGIPMVSSARSVYRIQDILDTAGTSLLRIARITKLSLSGSGLQSSRQVTVAGQGQSETLLTYDISQGIFLESDGQSILELSFETLRQRQFVNQRSVSRVLRRLR